MPPLGPLVVLTGPSGAGKSTLCRRVVAVLHERGANVRGLLTELRRGEDGRPAGIDIGNAATDARRPLAEWDTPTGGPVVGRWHFHTEAFHEGLEWCAGLGAGTLLVIDELGPLELVEGAGWAPLLPVVRDHSGPALVVVRPALVAAFTARMPGRSLVIVEIDPPARDRAAAAVFRALGLQV